MDRIGVSRAIKVSFSENKIASSMPMVEGHKRTQVHECNFCLGQ